MGWQRGTQGAGRPDPREDRPVATMGWRLQPGARKGVPGATGARV